MEPNTPEVLVVGGSLVGLSSALFLATRGVSTLLVEPHLGSHPHPRAVGYTARTMELFRAVGVVDRIPEAPASFRLRRCRVESLAGAWHDETPWTPEAAARPSDPGLEPSPHRGAAIAQDRLEPLLRGEARARGAELRLGAELLRFTQDADGVTAQVRDPDGRAVEVRARFMIAADGGQSGVREALGIARRGRGFIRTVRSVLFEAPLDAYLARGVSQFEITQPGLAAFLTTYGDGRWVLMFLDDVERPDDALVDAIFMAIGRRDLPVRVLATGRWELTALVAERFAEGRVFLAGDAAHTLPPTRGGFGANTGIHDAYDLAWKLEAVLRGRSGPALLDTYDAERRPVAWTRLLQTFARPDYAREARGIADGVALLDDVALELGQLYRSNAVLGAGPELPEAARPDQWRGPPGARAPHRWVDRAGARISTLDLFGAGWVLVADGDRWRDAAASAGQALGIDLDVVRLGVDVRGDDLAAAFGLEAGGASLVRPDGVVAWRTIAAPDDPAAALTQALAAVAAAPGRGS
ncbi:MAG: FAD-dependent monooxygenase [Nannocystaceae bacterium]